MARNGRRYWPWVVAAVLIVGNLFLHKPISDVCDALYARIGRGPYEWLTLLAFTALSAGGALLLIRRRAAHLLQPPVLACVFVLAACTVAAQRGLLVTNVELVHLPQFGLLAVLLLWSGLGPRAAWIGATLGGVLDEGYQHLVIYAEIPGAHLDFNDIVLNAIGAAWAVIFGVAGRGAVGNGRRAHGAVWPVAVVAALGISWWLAPPRFEPSDRFPYQRPKLARAATGRYYHIMPASEAVAALLLLWGLVAVATRQRGRRGATSARPAIAASLCAVALGCASHPSAAPLGVRSPGAATGNDSELAGGFITTFWCGPPLPEFTDARAAQVAAAGFNVVGAPCEGPINAQLNRQALDIAARHGLVMWIGDRRLSQHYDLDSEWEANLVAAVADYADHPALHGYALVDEPGAEKFPDLGKVVARLQEEDPRRLPYINLLPDFVSPEGLGTATYREHVEQFMTTVRPPLLSFDHYPFKTDTDRPSFFANLELVREVALQYGVPFMLILQAMPHGPYRDPTEAEVAWQVNHALAFGARGISYFAYWTPVNVESADRMRFRRGLIEGGQPTEHLAQATRINAAARAVADQLSGWRSIAVADSQRRFGTSLPVGPLAGIDGGSVTIGFFGNGGTLAALLVNQDYQREQEITLRQLPGAPAPEVFDTATGRWARLPDLDVHVAPGGARLLRWRELEAARDFHHQVHQDHQER